MMAISLAYPYDAPYAHLIILPNPSLGNSRQLNLKTMVKQNMFGSIYTHRRTPTNSKFLLNFVTMTQLERNALETFYKAWIGQEIRYIDYEIVSWRVRIATTQLVITENKDGCSYNAVLELLTV
jgi:hypothetical protein